MKTWLWPDHTISKSESRTLREEHNALVNLNADLLERLLALTPGGSEFAGDPMRCLEFVEDRMATVMRVAANNTALLEALRLVHELATNGLDYAHPRNSAAISAIETAARAAIAKGEKMRPTTIDVSSLQPHELAKALDAEVRAMGDDYTGQWLRVRYEHCGMSWEEVWPCACDTDCPVCGLDVEATSWEEEKDD